MIEFHYKATVHLLPLMTGNPRTLAFSQLGLVSFRCTGTETLLIALFTPLWIKNANSSGLVPACRW